MDKRGITQFAVTLITNANLKGFWQGTIYKGNAKHICVPGLNCYSCPGALGACPIGAMQAVATTMKYNFSFYAVGFSVLLGAVFGRLICGWLCPFALIQELLYKIPIHKINVHHKLDKMLRYLKYIVLGLFVIILPMFFVNQFGLSSPYFCEYICPAGTLEGGIPLILFNQSLRSTLGFLFVWKFFILAVIILLSVVIYRPFCKYICPLGAFYALFNKISFYQYQVDKSNCTDCSACRQKCKMGIDIQQNPNSMECIRCGECIKACPVESIKSKFIF